MVVVPASVLFDYRYFSLFNSPYPSHSTGRAIDLYPPLASAPSPVSGHVSNIHRVRSPEQSYGEQFDYLIVIDTGERNARVLHVEPTVREGDDVSEGDSLGRLVRSGYFAPWVENHIHLEFRAYSADPMRATGSVPIEVTVPIEAVKWNGSGRIVSRGDSFVTLDGPAHPCPSQAFAGVAAAGGVIDGGFPHYETGGILGNPTGSVRFLGKRIGKRNRRTVTWDSFQVLVNGCSVTGISFVLHRDAVRVKLVSVDELPLEVGDAATVTLEESVR